MNTVEKVVAEAKTQKEAVEKLMNMSANWGGSISREELALMVKDMKNNRESQICRVSMEFLLAKEREHNRARQAERLARSRPEDKIAKAIADLDEKLAKWFDEAKKDPFYQLSWGGKAYELAARRKAYLEIQLDMKAIAERDGELTKKHWDDELKEVAREATSMARSVNSSRSTSRCSNLAEDCLMAAKAAIASGDDWVIGEITWWFKEKEEFDREGAE
jgi:hypothetical protein